MGTEHRFRDDRGVEVDAFDWVTPAEQLEIPLDEARALYEEALRRSMYPGSRPAEELYLEWLATREPGEPLSDPGRHTLTMRIGQPRRREHARRSRVPGKRSLTAGLAGPRPLTAEARGDAWSHVDREQREQRSGGDAFARGLEIFLGRGAGAPGAAQRDEASAHEPGRAAQAPPGREPGWSWTLLPGGGQGRSLPSEVAARLGPHVGTEAAGAARLHTDDTADQVAAAHRARAVAIGDAIYFARGEYAPGTERGDELLAHELTHVAQARSGQLDRAAAKGIESGSTLDPAEAEADLRAKLAVIQLHAPEGAAPELAAPSGQPTSEGERAAKLAAQQQRLMLAGQGAPGDAAVPEPPTSTPQAPVAHAAPPMTAAPAPASSGNAYVDTFEAPPSKQATELWDQAGAEATTQAAADRSTFEAGLEPLPVVLDGSAAPPVAGGGPGSERTPEQPPEGGTMPSATEPTPTPETPSVTAAGEAAAALQPSADPAQMRSTAEAAITSLPANLPEVATEPGPAPVTDLAGQADPARALGDHHHAVGEGAAALEAEKAKVIQGPGAAQVQPVVLDEQLEVPAMEADGPMPGLPTVEGMTKLKQWNLPAEAHAAFDEVAKPKMAASLAEAKAKMTEAQTQRDTERARAVDDAHEKVKLAHADADQQQQTKVAATRTQIANRQAETLVKQEQEVKKLEQQSGEKKQGAVGKIQDRLSADQAKVEADYADAKTRADEEKRRGEEEVARKKREAEEEANRDQSWWEQAADAICDAVEAIAEEIDDALDAIGEAIGQILDAVKEAACQLIDAAAEFVCQALTEFGDWLKSAVTALIGSVFPELAAELNRLIDEAVTAATEAVTAIADGLKAAVTALCDGLKAAIEAAIAAFKAAVQAAATFVQALVTGDWSLVAKMVLDGILAALGIDPAAFYALIAKAQDSIETIIEDPGAFVGHLIDAVKLGFSQFGSNFWTHLQAGVVQWLFGTFAEAGIQMPASFDIAGIFDLVMQVLGLTWDRLRVKVVGIIGEENTERLEFVSGYVEALVTGGLSGLWEKVQQDLSSLWDMVIGGIKDWLIETVVQQAIIKIATMWNPAGAIIQLIQTAWNVYQWVRENAQRIFGLVQAVVDSVAAIAAGDISGAANWIEQSLANLLPIAISLFANLIGLGGLADHIRGIIERVQQTISDAIDKLIERVRAMFRGNGGAADGEGEGAEEEPEVPTSMVEPTTAEIEQLSPAVSVEIDQAAAGTTILYQAANRDPKAVTESLLATHRDARLDNSSARLTLSPIQAGQLRQAQTLPQLGEMLAQQTGVSTVELQRDGEGHAEIVGSINPRATFAQLVINKRFQDAKDFYIGDKAAFAIDDITIAGVLVPGLKTTIDLEATQARRYLQEWVSTGKVREITSPHPPTKVYVFTPPPTADDLLVPKNHPEYGQWMSGCAQVPIPAADAERDWDLLIVGLRDSKPANFELVAASLMRNMSIPPGKGALWSGGEDLSDYAGTQGCTTLEQQDFYKATKGLTLIETWTVARNAWAAFSRLYASQLRGKVHVYMRRFAPTSVLVEIELKKIDEMLRAPGGVPGGLNLRYHGMEWGDDPNQKLNQPLWGYWRELGPAGNPLPAGAVLEQDQAPAAHAVGVAEQRFRDAQAAKP